MIHRKLSLLAVVICLSQITYAQNQNETVALAWLNSNFTEIQSQKTYELRRNSNQVGASGETIRFGQYINNVPVYNVSVAVHVSPNTEVTYHSGSFKSKVSTINTTPRLSSDQAVTLAAKSLGIEGSITQKESKLYVYNTDDVTRLVYRVTTNSKTLDGFWETMVDANTGNIISEKDIAHYYHAHNDDHHDHDHSFDTDPVHPEASNIPAKGKIFNPDPLSVTGNIYGGTFMDNDDATNDDLDAARTDVSFLVHDSVDGLYSLKGDYLEIKDIQDPETGLFQQETPDFAFTRDQDGFEAVNAYYHIDKNMRYINETLGIPLKSIYNDGIIYYDPHAFNGADNSSYGGGILKYGIGGVDDAEDADVIVHELGHGIHEWLIKGSISQVEGLSEGFGDYWAQSYSRGLERHNSSRTHSAYNDLFKWDGHNEYWGGRVTNYDAHYPEGLTGKIHTDGQIFASTLMEVWEVLGKETTDKIVLEGIAMTGNTTTQAEAMVAIRQAAIDMDLECGQIEQLIGIMNNRGYNVAASECARLSVIDNTLAKISIYPNPAQDFISFKNITKDQEISIYSIMGQKVLQHKVTAANNTVNVSELSKGMYVVSFNDNASNYKFIKQ